MVFLVGGGHFNSIKVRLKLQAIAALALSGKRFQFHKGTIKTLLTLSKLSFHSHFNSIKVRLKPLEETNEEAFAEFQFHKGTIKTLKVLAYAIGLLHFNSIKVRLKR